MHVITNLKKNEIIPAGIIILLFLAGQAPLQNYIKGVRLMQLLLILYAGFYFITRINRKRLLSTGKWIIFSILLLIAYSLLGHGNTEQTMRLVSVYAFALSLFIIGFYWGEKSNLRVLNTILLILFFITTLSIVPYVFSIASEGLSGISKSYASEYFGVESAFIIYWPYVLILGSISFAFVKYGPYSIMIKKVSTVLFFIFLASLIISAFTAVLIMLLIAFLVYGFIVYSRKSFIKAIVTFVFFSGFVILFLILISKGTFGELGGTSYKIKSFVNVFDASSSQVDNLMMQTTSGRWDAFGLSLRSFFLTPIFGKGFIWITKLNRLSTIEVASQHSSILDGLAYFGVFSLVILMVYISFIKKSYSLLKLVSSQNDKKKIAILFSVLVAHFTINFMNPYFFTLIDNFIFFIGGFIAGYLSWIDKQVVRQIK